MPTNGIQRPFVPSINSAPFWFVQPKIMKLLPSLLPIALAAISCGTLAVSAYAKSQPGKIDRHALVTRHNVLLTKFDTVAPLQVGNGEFAFGMDATGLQTFVPFNTMSHWGWHQGAVPAGHTVEEFQGQVWDTHGRAVKYPMPDPAHPDISNWLAASPHRINLGRIGLVLLKRDGTHAAMGDISEINQQLDLWNGIVTSKFVLEGAPVTVVTACHPVHDAVAVQIESPLIQAGRLSVFLACPGNNPLAFANYVGDWDHPYLFEQEGQVRQDRADFVRKMDEVTYHVSLSWQGDAQLTAQKGAGPEGNRLLLRPAASANSLSFTCGFSRQLLPQKLPTAEQAFAACRQRWPAFWKQGGAIDLSGSRDTRWKELERRIVLSQYLMKVNEAGSQPPQESGLVNNGWYGRFHMEMIWWHDAQWALWNRWPELNRCLNIYSRLLPKAQELAKSQGYSGARWPKCIGPDGREWPHEIHALLIWQQPHPIFFAELDYRAHPTSATLNKWLPVVEATADFLASYAFLDKGTGHYVLGPPLQVVSENANPKTAFNPTFELGYWRFGLRTAQEWRKRLGQAPNPEWEKVLNGLAPLPLQEGLYVLHEGIQDMWTHFNFEHPALTGVYGVLPGDGVDLQAMRRTLDKVYSVWNFEHTWGWDFPMLAMCAARLGEPERAVDFLLHPASGFQFDAHGLATGGPFPYFPSNGGLLYAVAMMAAGWNGGPGMRAPGFPKNGQWVVKYENLQPAP